MAEAVFEHPKIHRAVETLSMLMYTSGWTSLVRSKRFFRRRAEFQNLKKGLQLFKEVVQDPEIHKRLEEEFGIKDAATRTATIALKLFEKLHDRVRAEHPIHIVITTDEEAPHQPSNEREDRPPFAKKEKYIKIEIPVQIDTKEDKDIPDQIVIKADDRIPLLFSELSVLATSTILKSLMKNPDVKNIPKLLAKIQTFYKHVEESLHINDKHRKMAMDNLSLARNLVKARLGDPSAKAYIEHKLSEEAKKLKKILERLPSTKRGDFTRTTAINRYLMHYKVAKLAGVDVKEHAEVFRRIVGKYPEEFIQGNA